MEFIKQNKLFSIILLLDIATAIFCLFCYDPTAIDTMEHIRASYFISIGKIPYVDFFEHHHPFLWYLFAPIIKILPHNPLLIYFTARFCSLLFSIATLYILYLILKNYLEQKQYFWYFLLLLFMAFPCIYGLSFFKPDTFARFFYFVGLYSFFAYIEKEKTYSLVICFFSFMISFFFLQTFAFDILPLIVPALILFYNKPKFYYDMSVAAILPVLIIGIILYIQAQNNLLVPYLQMNWLFNKDLAELIHNNVVSIIWNWAFFFLLVFVGIIYQLKFDTNKYFKILCYLFVCEIIQHLLIKVIFPHYLILTFIFAALVSAPLFYRSLLMRKYMSILLIAMLALNFTIIKTYYKSSYLQTFNKINQTPHSAMSLSFCWLNIYSPQITFYDLVPIQFAAVDEYLFQRSPEFDINKIINQHNFKYIDYNERISRLTPKIFNKRFIPKELHNYQEIEHCLYQRIDTLPENQ